MIKWIMLILQLPLIIQLREAINNQDNQSGQAEIIKY